MNSNSLHAIPSPGNNQNFTQQALESADWVSGASLVSNLFFSPPSTSFYPPWPGSGFGFSLIS